MAAIRFKALATPLNREAQVLIQNPKCLFRNILAVNVLTRKK